MTRLLALAIVLMLDPPTPATPPEATPPAVSQQASPGNPGPDPAALAARLETAAAESAALAERLRAAERVQAAERGRTVYRRACRSCHGAAGDGRGSAAEYLQPRPRDFTRGEFRFRSTGSDQPPTDDDILATVSLGVPGTAMPAWERLLPERERRDVIEYVKMFSLAFAGASPARLPLPESEPPSDAGASTRGRVVFRLLQCWQCHGLGGRGDGPAAATLVDSGGVPIRAADLTRGTFKTGHGPLEVYRVLATGFTGTPMPQYEDAFLFGRDGFEDLSTFVLLLPSAEIEELRSYLSKQPTTSALESLPDAARRALVARRRWDLATYVRSLRKPRGVMDFLLDNPWSTPAR